MPKEKILVVDDEADILELVQYNLAKEGYLVTCVASGEEALAVTKKSLPDLLILDLMLPGVDGLDVCKTLRRNSTTATLPIIMLTAKGEEADIVAGLELGADDYLTKPFSPRVLSARVKTVLRRRRATPQDDTTTVRVEELIIDPRRHEVQLDGKRLDLTVSEFKILHFLVRQRGWVFTRHQIVDAVHGDDYPVTDRSVDVQMVGLRKKLNGYGKFLETVRGVGYKFSD